MGNKASSNVPNGKRAESSQEESVKTSSCSSFGTHPSDSNDQLRELVEATKEQPQATSEDNVPTQPRRNVFSKLGNVLFGDPPESSQQETSSLPPAPIKVRLCHCETDDEHRAHVAEFLNRVRDLYGEEGLREAGFEYRKLYCSKHEPSLVDVAASVHKDDSAQEEKKCDTSLEEELTTRTAVLDVVSNSSSNNVYKPCFQCATRLYYCETNTLITQDNRKLYIADGAMYEEVTRLAQECAQEAMQREGNLEWVTVCDDPAHSQPVRALVHEDHHRASKDKEDTADDHPTLLVATGKGKVKAGIFSRQHLLTSGMESSTALPMVIEAAQRNMSVVIFDPNARGDRKGMETFEKSFEVVLGHLDHNNNDVAESGPTMHHEPSKRALYIVAHSASGSQLVRYMLDRVHGYLPYLRAIAFTDSTHNIQWTRKNAALQSLLGSKKCVYFRSASKNHDDLWHTRKAGDTVETDSFWEHRFGGIKTLWAGTEEHSLMNWFSHHHIWSHFDEHMSSLADKPGDNKESDAT